MRRYAMPTARSSPLEDPDEHAYRDHEPLPPHRATRRVRCEVANESMVPLGAFVGGGRFGRDWLPTGGTVPRAPALLLGCGTPQSGPDGARRGDRGHWRGVA